jgi:arylsulfatase A-like enzyme
MGISYGEHYLRHERRLAYEETIRIPLLVRYPKLFRASSRPNDFFLSVDMAKLCLRQTLPSAREDFLIEYESDTVFPRIRKMGYRAIRTRRWKYIHYLELPDSDELYDLASDPYELNNRIRDPRAPLADMKRRLARAERT